MKKFLIPFVTGFIIISCGRNPSNFENGDPDVAARAVSQKKESAIDRKLIKNGSLRFQTEDESEARKKIVETAKKYRGYIGDEATEHYDNKIELSMTLRVPAAEFDHVVADIEKLATDVESKNVMVKDVTEEFIDVGARLKTKKELEARYLSLLTQAKNVQDVIAVESQLNTVRGEIESMEGRMKYLTDQVSLSTLSVTCYRPIGTSVAFISGIGSALSNGWNAFLKFLIALLNLWPFIILAVAGAYLFQRFKKKKTIPVESKVES